MQWMIQMSKIKVKMAEKKGLRLLEKEKSAEAKQKFFYL